ncbi:MAG: hypothetical protein ACRDYC_11550 [Acidimicrobiales bacterium]
MGVRADCRHYLLRSTNGGDGLERCRLAVNKEHPFACPEGCLFFEARSVSGPAWTQAPAQPMSNTAHGIPAPETNKRKRRGRR